MSLENELNTFLKNNFNNIELSAPVFFNFPISIRFEIGIDSDDVDNYVQISTVRSVDIFNEVFDPNDILYVVVESPCDDLNNINIVRPLISSILSECNYEVSSLQDDFLRKRYVIKSIVKSVNIPDLLEKIIRSELDGTNNLSGNIYLLNSRNGVIYYLYDDRGLDVAAPSSEHLKKLYENYQSWILISDKEKISKVFEQ